LICEASIPGTRVIHLAVIELISSSDKVGYQTHLNISCQKFQIVATEHR
jgi:hypothetical protein